MIRSRAWKTISAVIVALLIVVGGVVLLARPVVPRIATEPESGSVLVSSVTRPDALFLESFAVKEGNARMLVGEDASSAGSMYTISHDGKTVAFMGVTKLRIDQALLGQIPVGTVQQIYVAPRKGRHIPPPSEATQLTQNPAAFKGVPSISDDGESVAYAWSMDAIAGVSSSTINLVTATMESSVATGTSPVWYSATAFYYLALDGVRLYDMSAKSSVLVLPFGAQSNFKLALSHDRRVLAFSNPNAGSLFLFAVSADGYELRPLATISVHAYWMVFSSDDSEIAVQTAEEEGTRFIHPSIIRYSAQTGKKLGMIVLDPLVNDHLFVTTWLE